ncbi:uncharacterized protein PHACADRAFT_183566 [Phanerochaete carnosa HHB-10118-sp]|uniref:Uncharacterized protein n=1 Tax=Phanerochaete carnosa (strain HHB-10118-sp) TaxID=650164 RepID=K5VZM0_PHACS|nr:uncharacterized protein PHACADRAFT_183566 [Phanerochaete carnosa HHB-10118-sp]EKM57028.1 hypothetical protein PHACADRAFT_183566 [Phanerochaete carnosa HHB-10118-sp]
MDHEVVLPSDSEELEEYLAEQDPERYWRDASLAIAKNLERLRVLGLVKGSESLGSTKNRGKGKERLSRSDDEAVSRPARKRVKLSHSFSDENLAEISRNSYSRSPLPQRQVALDISNTAIASSMRDDLEPFLLGERVKSPQHKSSKCSPDSSLDRECQPEAAPSTHTFCSDNEDQDFFPHDEHDQRLSSQSYVVPSPAGLHRCSVSPDPLLLLTQGGELLKHPFIPSAERCSQPATIFSKDDPEDDIPIAGPSRPRPAIQSMSLQSSPARKLSPFTSPLSSPSPSPRPSPTRPRFPARDASLSSPHTDADDANASLISQLQQAENASRYKLRERNVRQLQPYAYDQQIYKRQMRANPDAIVRYHSPARRRHRSRERSVGVGDEQSSDAEVDPARLEAEASEDERPRRRRTRSETDNEEGVQAGTRGRTELEAAPSTTRQMPPRQVVPTVPPVATSSKAQSEMDIWFGLQKSEFDNRGSSSDEELGLQAQKRKGKEKGEVEETSKRKKKRFPMRDSKFLRTERPSPRRSQIPESPKPRPHRRHSQQSDSSEVEVFSPARALARFPSRQSSSDPWDLDSHTRFDDRVPSPNTYGPPESSSSIELDRGLPMDVNDDNLDQGGFDFQQSQDRDGWDLDVGDRRQPDDDDVEVSLRSEVRILERTSPHGSSTESAADRSDSDKAASASNFDSDEDADPSALPEDQFHKRYRREFRELYRMYPPARARTMILDNMKKSEQGQTKATRRRESVTSEDAPLQPGRARARIGSAKNVVIRGDSESEDEVRRSSSPSPSTGLRRSASQPSWASHSARAHAMRPTLSEGVISISSDEDASRANDGEGDEIEFVYGPTRVGRGGEIREGPLVDYILNRTGSGRGDGKKRKRTHGSRAEGGSRREYEGGRGGASRNRSVLNLQTEAGRSRRPAGRQNRTSGSSATRIVTGGARRHGAKRQTLLNFPRLEVASAPALSRSASTIIPRASASTSALSAPALDLTVGQLKSDSSKPAWKKSRHRTRERVYFMTPHISTVVSGGRGRHEYHTTVLEQDVPESERRAQAIMHFPLPRFEPRKRKVARQPEASRQRALPEVWRSQDAGAVGGTRKAAKVLRKKDPITIDLNTTKLPSGIIFAEHTYLGRGYLHALLSPPAVLEEPIPGYVGNARVSTNMSPTEFATVVGEAITEVLGQLKNATANQDVFDDWQRYLQVIRPWSAWFLASAPFEDSETLRTSLEEGTKRTYALIKNHFAVRADSSPANALSLQLQWTAIELLYRMRPSGDQAQSLSEDGELKRHIKLLTQHLRECNLDQPLSALWPLDVRQLDYSQPIRRIAELWVCLIHLVEEGGGPGALWKLLLEVYQSNPDSATKRRKEAKTGEEIWAAIYSCMALSQFSLHGTTTSTPRLSNAWALVVLALESAPLAAEAGLSERVLKKRDLYFQVLLSRCVWLHTHWKWTLGSEDAEKMFRSLLDVFKSRRFANLLQDRDANFPSFLEDHKLVLLQSHQEGDSAFTSVLKFIVQAAKESNDGISPHIKKVVELAVPLSSLSFTKSCPASLHESSKLYNRLSAVAVTIYLEPTEENARSRLERACRYVKYEEADQGTREACIRGAMHLAILLQHFELPLTSALEWLGDMTNVLIEELVLYKAEAASRAKSDVLSCLQMILWCVRRIIETPRMDSKAELPKYPEPKLLQGPWVTRIFVKDADLASISNATLEMRMLVQTFLKARSAVIPRRQPQRARQVVQEESQEYDDDDFDFNDPAILAMLGDADGAYKEAEEARSRKEEELCKIIEGHISRAVFRVLCARLISRHQQDQLDIDKWVECWTGCAEVLVRNGRRDWGSYFFHASQTWEKMELSSITLRRLNLHFSLTVLKLDPSAYAVQQDQFLKILFTCFAAQHPDLEAEYVSLVFTVDGLQHTLLRGLPYEPSGNSSIFNLSRVELVERRVAFLDCMLSRLEDELLGAYPVSPESTELSLQHIATMLSTMQDIHLSLDLPGRVLYAPFCSSVSALLRSKPNVAGHSLLNERVAWLQSIDASRQI